MNSKKISTDCYSFARGGPRASATSTHRPLPQLETKARQRSRQQRRRRVELGSNAACCPCSFPILHRGLGHDQVKSVEPVVVGTDIQVRVCEVNSPSRPGVLIIATGSLSPWRFRTFL